MDLRLLFILLPFLFSFSFSPMTKTLNIQKSDKMQFKVQNDTDKPIPVILKVLTRIQKADGSEQLPETNDFKVIPPQVIVPAKDKRSIKISYKGTTKVKKEGSYRVVAEQVPLDLENNKSSGIEMLIKYQAALYVTNSDFKSDLSISSFEASDKLKVVISNKGKAHQYLKNIEIYFEKGDKKITINKNELKLLEGQNILAGVNREFIFKAPQGLTQKFKAFIKYD